MLASAPSRPACRPEPDCRALRDRFPSRFFDVGIAEQHSVTMATGLALAGLRPVVALYSTFSQRAYDQLVHDVCQNGAPVLLAIDRAGLVGEDGTSHQGMFTLSAQRALPNLVIGSPKDEQELRDMVATAMQHDGPISLHYPRDAGRGPGGSNGRGAGDRSGRGAAIGRRPADGRIRADRAAAAGGCRPAGARPRPHHDRHQRPLGEAARRGAAWPSMRPASGWSSRPRSPPRWAASATVRWTR